MGTGICGWDLPINPTDKEKGAVFTPRLELF